MKGACKHKHNTLAKQMVITTFQLMVLFAFSISPSLSSLKPGNEYILML